MYLIDQVLISDEIFERKFVCNLDKCKGACCWEGDYGAPLNEGELLEIELIQNDLMEILSEESKQIITERGISELYSMNKLSTPLGKNGACAYMTKNEMGIAQCGFEILYNQKKSGFKKPISCHLYPIRITKMAEFEALNYDEWEICKAACLLGEELKVPVFRFLKEALIRKFGNDFYDALEAYYKDKIESE